MHRRHPSIWSLAAITFIVLVLLYKGILQEYIVFDYIRSPVVAPSPVIQSENIDFLGVTRYDHIQDAAAADVLWLTMTYDNKSWGTQIMGESISRGIDDLHEIIASQYEPEKVALALLTSSQEEFEIYRNHSRNRDYARVTLLMHPGYHTGGVVDREHRHDDNVQKARRSELAKLRNYLMLRTLQDEQHIVWLDADVFHLDEGIVRRMIKHTEDDPEIGILTARCELGEMVGSDYDINSWQGTRQGPRGWDLDKAEIENGEVELQGQRFLGDLVKTTGQDDLIPLSTVGATLLYMRSTLIHQGLSFPHQYTVGTRWGKDGWDGIESEGLCYRARGLDGGECRALGGSWHVAHA